VSCIDDLQTKVFSFSENPLVEMCSLCNLPHSVDTNYPSIEVESYCPMVLELNRKLLEAHLEERSGGRLGLYVEAPPLTSHADYLFRKAYFSNKPLRPDEQDKLNRLVKNMDRGVIAKKAWKDRKHRLSKYDERERRRRLDMGFRYDYLLDVWKMAKIPVELSREEFVSVVMGSFMVSYVYPWVGTVAEYIRDERDGGRGGSIRLERLDTRYSLRLGNIQLREVLPKEMRGEGRSVRKTVEVLSL
jgi:hypothetical protein